MKGATRIFASDYRSATLTLPLRRSSNFQRVITPGGADCNLLFVAGALTESHQEEDSIELRVSDPTGIFEIIGNKRYTEFGEGGEAPEIPSFVTVYGTAQIIRREGIRVAIRADSIREISRETKDHVILVTARDSLRRLERIYHVMRKEVVDETISSVIRHYDLTVPRLLDMIERVEDVVRRLKRAPERGSLSDQDLEVLIFEIITKGSGSNGISLEEIIEQAVASGIRREITLSALERLIAKDECYQPKKGYIRPL